MFIKRIFFIVLAVCSFFPSPSQAQAVLQSLSAEANTSEDTITNKIEPFNINDIIVSLNQTINLADKAANDQLTDNEINTISSKVDSLVSQIQTFLNDSISINLDNLNLRNLDYLKYSSEYLSEKLNKLLNELVTRSSEVIDYLTALSQYEKRWQLTLKTYPDLERSEIIVSRIQNSLSKIDSVELLLESDFEFFFNNQSRLSDEIGSLDDLKDKLKDKEKNIGKTLYMVDMPGLIEDISTLSNPGLFKTHISRIKKSFQEDFALFLDKFLFGILFFLGFFILIFLLINWSKKHYLTSDNETYSHFTRFGKLLIGSPVYTSIFISTLLLRLFFPELPQMIRVFNLMLLMIPVVYFLIHMYYRYVKSLIYSLLLIYILTFIFEFIFFPDIILRIFLLGYSISGFMFFFLVFKNKPLKNVITNKLLYGTWRIMIFIFILFQLTGIVGNFIGAFSMAEFFTVAPIHTLIMGITVFVTTKVAETLIPILLKSDILQELNVIREDFEVINKKTTRLIKVLMWGLFVILALRFFRIQEPFFEWGENLLSNGWKIGAIEISPRSVIIFIFIIWLSIVLSRIITQILEKDVFERIKVSRGVPATVTMVLKIIFIAGGFLLAAAAAGMELTNLSIIIGAFSVGIGFGLQNIFNNLVSGLIIAFERPIKVGDTVQVDQLMGTVKKIGLRSSTVKSFDGAEVIVPNGNIISNQMINWTLSDFSRRMDIRVGVAYGTNPEEVIQIMIQIAEEHEKVYKVPKPHAFFIGFGDSSLNFRLLAWCNIDNWLEAESEIFIQINKRLAEAGIEIPFPQRDIHIRSDETKKKATSHSNAVKKSGSRTSGNK